MDAWNVGSYVHEFIHSADLQSTGFRPLGRPLGSLVFFSYTYTEECLFFGNGKITYDFSLSVRTLSYYISTTFAIYEVVAVKIYLQLGECISVTLETLNQSYEENCLHKSFLGGGRLILCREAFDFKNQWKYRTCERSCEVNPLTKRMMSDQRTTIEKF